MCTFHENESPVSSSTSFLWGYIHTLTVSYGRLREQVWLVQENSLFYVNQFWEVGGENDWMSFIHTVKDMYILLSVILTYQSLVVRLPLLNL